LPFDKEFLVGFEVFYGCVRGDSDLFAYDAASLSDWLPTLGRYVLQWTKKSGLGLMGSENEANTIRRNVGKY
jgi:hypothetical protein